MSESESNEGTKSIDGPTLAVWKKTLRFPKMIFSARKQLGKYYFDYLWTKPFVGPSWGYVSSGAQPANRGIGAETWLINHHLRGWNEGTNHGEIRHHFSVSTYIFSTLHYVPVRAV